MPTSTSASEPEFPAAERLPRPAELVRRHRLHPQRRLGQHFLYDEGILRRIARAAAPFEGVRVVEIGPGPGGLTRALLLEGAQDVVAVEKDPRMVAALRELEAAAGGRLRVLEADALRLDLHRIAAGRPLVIVGNLPFNVGTELLLGWLDALDVIARMVLMFQREVAERLAAPPGHPARGSLSVLVQRLCRVERLFDVPPGAFRPPPKVAAGVVRLVPRPDRPDPALRRAFERVIRAAFGQRRKMLRTSLRALGVDVAELLRRAEIEGTRRAEELDEAAFERLARALPEMEAGSAEAG